MKRKTLLTLTIASMVMLTTPFRVWAEDLIETREMSSAKTLPSPRAAVAYTEYGVQYGYFGDQLSSDDMNEMKALLEPWKSEFHNLDIEGILTPAYVEELGELSRYRETWYMQIVGVKNDKLEDGVMYIHNDIGSANNYKTIAIDSTGLRGNTYIKKIEFRDCSATLGDANTEPRMVIHNGAFKDCSNLKELDLYYYDKDVSSHYDMLFPTDIYIGKNVFDGCHKDFRIVVDAQVYDLFINDPNWSQYKDKIVAHEHEDLAETFEEGGVKYRYYGYQLSNLKTNKMQILLESWKSEFANLDIDGLLTPASNGKETWYLRVTGVDGADLENGELRIYNDIGTNYNYKTIAIDSTGLRGNENIQKVVFEDCASALEDANTDLKLVIHDGAFKDCKNLKEFQMYYYYTDGDNQYKMLRPTDIYIGKNVFDGCHEDFRIVVDAQVYMDFIADDNWKQYADKIERANYDGMLGTIMEDGIEYAYFGNQLSNLNMDEMRTRLESWKSEFANLDIDGILTPASNGATTWYMQIVGADNSELDKAGGEMRIYNDIGTNYNYKTISIDGVAFNNNEHINRIVFEDCASASENANTQPRMVIHDGAFKGCRNLEELYMFYYITDGTNHPDMLSPTDIYIGKNVFDGCHPDFRIVVDALMYKDFITDANWSQYADKIVIADNDNVQATVDEYGVKYGYFGYQLSNRNIDKMKTLLKSWPTDFHNLNLDDLLTPASNGDETWYMQVMGVDESIIVENGGVMRIYNDIGETYNYKTISIHPTGLRDKLCIEKVEFWDCFADAANTHTEPRMVIHDGAFQGCKNLKEFNLYYYVTAGTNHYDMLFPTDIYIGKNVFDGCHEDFRIVVDAQVYDLFINDPNWSQYKDKIVASTDSDILATVDVNGVKYGYFGYQLSNRKMDKMKYLLNPWLADYRHLDLDDLLTPASNGDETWYMRIVGVDTTAIDAREGEMRIYNDIGDTYNYKTVAIDSTSLRGNAHIKKVVFEDCASALENANTDLKLVIHDGAFKGCKNLREFNMFYLGTEGSNHYTMIYPEDILIGKNVFDSCHADFRIVVAPQLYQMYTTDECWSQYADKIVAADYLPTVNDAILFEGVTYDYAAKSLNTLPTSELTRLQSSWWNAVIIGVEVGIAILTFGAANTATTSAQASAQATMEAAKKTYFKALDEVAGKAAEEYFTGGLFNTYYYANKAFESAMSDFTYYMIAGGVSAASAAGINGLGYITTTLTNKARREPSWILSGQWVLTENKHTIYHMYVKDVDSTLNSITLYNDIGSAYNYKTVAIGRDAFRGKDKLKELKFRDVNTGEMYESLTVIIPDSAFMDCTSLETVDLVMHSNYTNRDLALGPENFVLCGEDIFVGCDTTKLKIRVGSEKYDEFIENPYWAKYKNCFVPVEVPEVVDYTDFGAQYSYSFKDNSLKRETYLAEHNIEHLHIIAPELKELGEQGGELGLFNDIGIYNNYNLDYVKKKAFYGCEALKGISMFDLKGFGATGDAYSDLKLVLHDSAFAACPNLEYINMLYFRTDGTNSVEPMAPSRVILEDDVFADCPNLKIKMVTTAVEEFKADTAWAKYEDKFLPSFIQTKDETLMVILEECGMEYESPITGGSFDIYDVMQVTEPSTLKDKFKGQALAEFREFKAFECIGLNYVYESMFENCSKLQGIDLPSTLETIGNRAFYNCQLLDDVVIPASVTAVGLEAFYGCASLRSLTFESETPATLGENVFANMPEDYIIYVPDAAVKTYKAAWPEYADHIQNLSEKHTGIWEITVTEPGTLAQELGLRITGSDPLIVTGSYSKYDRLKITGPLNGTDIGVIRFMGGRDVDNCEDIYPRNLRYLDLYDADIKAGGEDYNQDGVNDTIAQDNCISTYMFWELDALQTLILPKSVTKIDDYAFNNCDALLRLVIGDNTDSIGEKVTHDSHNLKEVILLCDEAPVTHANAWSEDAKIGTFYVPNSYRSHISGSRVYYTRGDSIASTFIDDATMRALAEKRIYTFEDLEALTDFDNLVNGNTEIKYLLELVMASNVKELGDNSFSGCSSLESVMLPSKVKSISAGAFRGCTSLKSVNVGNDTIPTLAADAFESLPEDFVIYVAEGYEDAYRKAWTQYADHIQSYRRAQEEVLEVTVTEPGTLGEALGFTVTMDTPNDIGRIGGDIISIKALKVNGPINGKDIAVLRMLGGRDEEDAEEVILARMHYLDLHNATICTDPNNICFNRDGINDYVEEDNVIPEHMFWMLDALKTVILPKNVTKIDANAFYDCLNIETIIVGESTTYIGNDAFGECPNLKNILFLCEEKPELNGDAFSDPITDQPYQVEKIYVPLSLLNEYVSDKQYTTHTKEFCNNFEDDAVFRAFGSHAVMGNDQLQNVTNVDGWFDNNVSAQDLTSLSVSAVDTLKAATIAPLTSLQKITLPATLKVVEENAFANNTNLLWADFAECENDGVLTTDNIGKLGVNPKALIYAPEGFTPQASTDAPEASNAKARNRASKGLTNVVYGSKDDLKCDHFALADGIDYFVPRAFRAAAISYDREFVGGEMTTLCLPFDMKLPAGANVYMLDGEKGEYVIATNVSEIEAGKPYVIKTDNNMFLTTQVETAVPAASNDGSDSKEVTSPNYKMIGTFRAISAQELAKISAYLPGANDRWYQGTNQALLPYRAYMQATTSDRPSEVQIIFGNEEESLVIADGEYTKFENAKTRFVGDLTYTRTLNNTWNALYVPFQVELTEAMLANYDVANINNVRSIDTNGDNMEDSWTLEVIKYNSVGKRLEANHPYIIRPKNAEATNLSIKQDNEILYSTASEYQKELHFLSTDRQYAIKGVYNQTVSEYLDNGNYVYAINKRGVWQKMGLDVYLVPFRLYLTIANKDGSPITPEQAAAQPFSIRLVGEESEEGTTHIYDIEMDEEEMNVDYIYDLQGRRVLEPKKGNLYIINNQKVIF